MRIVSLDLDNTLWPTAEVVGGANSATQRWLASEYPRVTELGLEVQAVIKELRAAGAATPVDYRAIRYDALRVCARRASYDEDTLANEGFAVWASARREGATKWLDPEAVPALEAIKASGIEICAITNGLGDAMQIDPLRPFLDFCINADPASRKPRPDAFEAAARRYGVRTRAGGGVDDAQWVHVGDSLHDDVRGASRLGLRTVWLNPPESAQSEVALRWQLQRGGGKLSEGAQQGGVAKAEEKASQPRPDAEIARLSELPRAVAQLLEIG